MRGKGTRLHQHIARACREAPFDGGEPEYMVGKVLSFLRHKTTSSDLVLMRVIGYPTVGDLLVARRLVKRHIATLQGIQRRPQLT